MCYFIYFIFVILSPLACEVYFDNTPIPVENVLGEVGGGFKVNIIFDVPFFSAL